MLGKDHITLSVFTVSLILMPLLTMEGWGGIFILAVIAAGIGSLAPDVDSPDAAIFHKRVRGLKGTTRKLFDGWVGPFLPTFGYILKNLIYRPSVKVIQFLVKKDKLSLQYKVTEAHRGVLHSNLGLVITIIFLLIYSLILKLALLQGGSDVLSLRAILVFCLAFSLGFFLHLVEDACTVSGINFTFPFSKRLLFKGKIKTGEKDKYAKITDGFGGYLGVLNIGYFIGPSMLEEEITVTALEWELIVVGLVLLSWLIFFKISGMKRVRR